MRIVFLFLLLTVSGQAAYLGDISTTHSVTNLTALQALVVPNTFGVNAMVYAEGTGLQFTVYNAAGTPVYTNAATVGSASIALQKGAKMIVIAGTSGRAVPW